MAQAPTPSVSIKGSTRSLATIKRPNGSEQVTYKGMPLYTYTGDSKAGDATGQGLDGIWFVIKSPSAESTSVAKSPSTTAKSSGGYGY